MAVKIGTAADHIELWDALLDFLQNDPELVSAGQNWSVAWQHSERPEIVLEGPGLSGTGEVLVGLRRRADELTVGESVIDLTGMIGVIPSAADFNQHVGNLTVPPLFFLDQNPMDYWFVANGRRFVVVVKISTIYQAGYAGLFMPYARPTAYPAPLFIGGTRGQGRGTNSNTIVDSWRAGTHGRYRHFTQPVSETSATTGFASPAYMLDPSGQWGECGTLTGQDVAFSLPYIRMGPKNFPARVAGLTAGPAGDGQVNSGGSWTARLGYRSFQENMVAGLNGDYSLTPLTLSSGGYANAQAAVTYGVLDGCFLIPGEGNVAENIVTMGGVDHLVVANVQHTSTDEYWALALE